MSTRRKELRLKGYDYSQEGFYFVTINVQKKECALGEVNNQKMVLNEFGHLIAHWWTVLPKRFGHIKLDEYIIMPDHMHGIIQIVGAGSPGPNAEMNETSIYSGGETPPIRFKATRSAATLGQMMGFFKYQSTKMINEKIKTGGVRFWQRNYYEHIIRDEGDLNRVREYMMNNPKNWAMDEENSNKS